MASGDALGETNFTTNTIKIHPATPGFPRSENQMLQTFLHEVGHVILKTLGEDQLNADEKFVDLYAGLLLQILVTSEYKK
jgi:hypothetical protein